MDGHVACMEGKLYKCKCLVRKREEPLTRIGVGKRIILKLNIEGTSWEHCRLD
jgi:hypothetical protein